MNETCAYTFIVSCLLVFSGLSSFHEKSEKTVENLVFTGLPTTTVPSNLIPSNLIPSHKVSSSHLPTHPENKWIIVGFSDFGYLPAAKLWYKRLSKLGYTNHFIAALDENTLEASKRNTTFRALPANRYLPPVNSSIWRNPTQSGHKFKWIWSLRIQKVLELLEAGFNVFLTDVDSIWLKYMELSSLPDGVDVIHAKCPSWPKQVSEVWGFVVCGGVAGYRSNGEVVKLFRFMRERCIEMCDDQKVLNFDAYFRNFGVQWDDFGSLFRTVDQEFLGEVDADFKNGMVFSYGRTNKYLKLKMVLMNEKVIGRMSKFECDSLPETGAVMIGISTSVLL